MTLRLSLIALALPVAAYAHTADHNGLPMDKEMMRKHIADEFMAKRMALAKKEPVVTKPTQVAALGAFDIAAMFAYSATVPGTGNVALMFASFEPFKPGVRVYNDANYFYVEGDSMPDATLMPTPMVGITAWQQQLPIPVGYFSNVTNPEPDTGSLGYGQPNVWKIPLVPVPAASPISLTGNFLRGAVALGANGIPIFNPRNNTGQFSQAIGELDAYGGHCGRADDYHYHIAPTHLYSVLTTDKPCAWALDGYPIYGYVEPDGTAQQALDTDGGHNHGTWGYHYHARGSVATGPQSPYLMNAMHGAVVNFGGQIDPQPTASSIAPAGSPLAGATITGFTRPATDSYVLSYSLSGTTYNVSYTIDRVAHTVAVTTQSTSGTTNATYTSASRFNYYPVAPWSMAKLPDTGQTLSATATFGEDSDYTRNALSFTDNGNGTVTDNNTGLMWQKTDSGEMTWDTARTTGATSLNLAGYTDWRLPTAQEAFCMLNHERNPALDPTYFVNNAGGTPGYFWTSDLFYGDNTKVWCTNTGGGLGPHNKTTTISAGGAARHHARYVRGQKPTTGHHYINSNDGTVTDLDTGLMWTQVPSAAQSWSNALTYAEGLNTAGFSDWRLPNIKELQSLQDIPRATASGATTNPCINRVLFPAATATAYWSSTSVKSGTPTQAWLVDFGVTTTSTPSRNQQGITSYEPYASTYPVFAVREAPVIAPTQIVVEQPSPAQLTDGISTVAFGSVNIGSTLTKTFVIRNTSASSALSITGVTIDGTHGSQFTLTTPPASSIAASGNTTMVVQFAPTTAGAKTAAIHIASSDTTVGAAFDINLTGTGATVPPTITGIATTPTVPSTTDTTVSATITPAGGATITSATLTYSTGSQTTTTVFNEPMSTTATATGGWDGTGATYAWTVNSLDGAGNIKQTAGTSNHTTGITGSCGVVLGKGSATSTDPTRTMITTTNAINATGTFTSGSTTTNYIEFWVRTVGLSGTNGWSFQLAPNGTAFTERVSEFTGSVHGYQLYHYNLLATDLTSTLKMRFGFVGNGVGGPTGSTVNIDDIVVVTTSGSAPTPVTMSGPANGGTFTAQIPAQVSGTTITYSMAATDSNGQTTTITNAGSYTTSAFSTPPNVVIILTGGTGVTNITGTATLGVFTVNATGLATNSAYTFKAYAINSAGTSYSTAGTFSTLTANLPTITLPTVTNILNSSATLGGNVTADGGATISARGVVWSVNGTNSNPLIGGAGVTNVVGTGTTGVFTVNATAIPTPAPQTIAFKAYPTNAAGTVYTNVTTFQTVSLSSLSNLLISAGTLTPTFASNTLAYTASVPNSVSSITVTPFMVSGTATVTVNTVAVTPGTASGSITLNVGANTITVVGTQVTPASTRTYTVTVTRAAPSAPLITTPTSTAITATSATLGGNVTSDGGSAITARGVVLAPTTTNNNPQIGGSGVTNVVGTGTTGVFTVNATSLTAGTAYSFAAYATNSLGTTYTTPVSTFTTPSLSGDLSNLVISAGTLTPAFTSATISYTASVSNATTSINVTPTVLIGTSTITVNSVPVSSGSPSAVALNIGSNPIDVVVTGLDSTVKTYSVTVTRASGNPIVVSPTATGLSTTTATLGGNVTNDGGTAITARGIVLAPTATNSNPQLGGSGVTNITASGTTGVFTVSATGLTLGVNYTFAAYATNSAGTGYSVTGTFTTPRNNILLIIADDFGLDACKLYNPGGNNATTPNIDALAANGVRFNNAYAYAVCSPTRSAIITGRYGFRTGTGDVITGGSGSPLQASEFTLPDAFAANSSFNYQLKHLGKYHLVNGSNTTAQQSPVTVAGWPSYAGGLGAEPNDFFSWTKVITDGTGGGTSSATTTTYATTDTANDAISFINTQTTAGKPWFAWVAFNAPHFPFHKPPTSLLTTQAYIDLSGTAGDITANRLSYYNAAVQALDTEIGRVLASVDLNVTTVILIGDNGTDTQVAQSPYSSTHAKNSLYEGGVRVPLIIRGPNVVSPGRTSNTLVHALDLYSTILELAGINVATTTAGVTLDSQSLLPVLQNQAVSRPLAYSELFNTATPTFGGEELRDSQYKLIRPNSGSNEFYDLIADPYEAVNLIAAGLGGLTPTQLSAYYQLLADLGAYSTTAPTTINSVTLNPTTPTTNDSVTLTANVTPAAGASLSSVNLTYSTGSQATSVPFREVWSNGSTTSGLAGANNAWTATAVRNVNDVKQRSALANRTTPIILANCITNGTTTVTCTSTSGLGAGMNIAGPTIAGGTTIASVTNNTTFVLSTAAIGSSTQSLTVSGVTLTSCVLQTAPTILCDSTAGLAVGMRLTGVTSSVAIPLVATIVDSTHFTASGTITAVTSTVTASGCGLEFAFGNANLTDTMATLTNPIDLSTAVSASVDFYVRNAGWISTNSWAFQVSSNGGSTWTTRDSETYTGMSAASCTLTAASTTITTANTSGLSIGNSVQGTPISVASCTTSNVTTPTVVLTANTGSLLVGMFVSGTGIPANSRITAISAGVSFTMNNSATAAGTVTLTANYLNNNATITAINPGVSFTVSTAPQLTASGITLFAPNHDFQVQSYAVAPSELTANFKMRFQFTGSAANATCNIDDISVTTVSGNAPVTLAMTAIGGGNYSATIPGQALNTNISYSVLATDSTSGIDYYASSYNVIAGLPVFAVTPATGLSSSGTQASGVYSPSSQIYTLSNTGTGSLNWTASKSQTWLNLSATSGTLAAGASTNVTASINTANANALAVGTFNDTVTFTNTTNSSGNTTRSASILIGSSSLPGTPAITALPTYSQGTARNVRWPAISGATSYTLQISTTSNFATVLGSQTVGTPSASFTNLTHGTTYYYRVLATNGVGSSSYSSVVSSTQDNVSPIVAITSPSSAQTTATNTITLSGTSSDALSGISKVTVNGATATTSDGFATWTITTPLGFGSNSLTALAIDNAGNTTSSTPLLVTLTTAQTFNPLVIPDIITGTTFNLALKPKTKQFLAGAASNTNAYNDMLYGAPTLIMNKGDWVQMHVTNNLAVDTTTTHWHGFHIPAIMDGGPHQVIPAGTTWSPSWLVDNHAATYWFHPHLHEKTQEQISRGGVGMIIIRDEIESALTLPRTYGVDDIPLALGSRRFTTNQIVTVASAYGDVMLVNGVINPQVSLPKQYVRLRILNAEIERSLNLGFSDNRTFWVIATDGGLVNAPVATTRIHLAVGERAEILVDLTNDTLGGFINLMAYNNSASLGTPLSNSYPGGEPQTTGQFGSLLNNIDFNILRINIAAQTASPVLTRPTTLTTNALSTNGDVTNPTTRTLAITGGAPGVFFFDGDDLFSPTVFNHTINYNAVERWTITNTSGFSHSFHIHDVEFAMISRVATGGGNVVTSLFPYEVGWKDTLYVQRNSSVTFLAKFDYFASNTNPYMYHCHFANHEDEGLMGQFVVVNNATEDLSIASFTRYGNNSLISLDFKSTPGTTYTLQYSPDLTTWSDVGSVTSDGNSANFTETDQARLSGTKCFYRVKLPTITSP